jgi:predicted nucleic acid-binding protein
MIFVDTGYLLALLNPRDELHERAQAWASSVSESLLTTEYVVWELVNSFSMPIDRSKVHMAVEAIRGDVSWECIPASTDLFEVGLQLHREREDKEWSLTDCISFHVMSQRGTLNSLTYDHHFEQAGFVALLRRDPKV